MNNTFNYNSRSITGHDNKPFSDLEDIIGRSNSKVKDDEVEDNGGLLIFEDMDNSNFDEEERKNASVNSPRSSSGSSFN